jgi:nucleoside-diphosphate-sugar epimerase
VLPDLRGKQVFLTGATGFIGTYVACRLHAEGAHVLALERTAGKGSELAAAGLEVVQGDINDHARMRELVREARIVIHNAARLLGGRRADFLRDNVEATRNLAQASANAEVERFVYVSSVAAYGGIDANSDVDERTSINPFGDAYGDSKILAETAVCEVARGSGISYSIARPGMVYGPRSPGWTVRLIQLAKRGLLPLLDGGYGTAHPIYIDDLVNGLLSCASHPDANGQAFNFVNDGPITWNQFFGAYMRMVPTDRALRLPGIAVSLLAPLLDPFASVGLTWAVAQLRGRGIVLNQKAKTVLGWQPQISLDEGMLRSEHWLREEGFLSG